MATETTTKPTTTTAATKTNAPLGQLGYTLYAEIIRTLRIPALLIPSLIFPSLFFILFGIPNAKYTIGSVSGATYLMVSYGCYAAMSTSFLSFGIGTASERGMGWNKLLRASPINPLLLFIAKFVSILVVVMLSLFVLFAVSITLGHVRLPLTTWLAMTGTLFVGMIPFVALGQVLGYAAGPNSAPAIGNLIFIPLSFFSGILIPITVLPDFAKNFAPLTPSYHVGQLAWSTIGAGDSTPVAVHLLWVAGYTVAFVILALLAYRREERRTFG
jgi:ABC-2 type transport system permease protein